MASTQVPAVIDQLVTRLTTRLVAPAFPRVTVYDGFGVSGNQGDFVMIGVDNPASMGPALTATSTQENGPMGTNRPRDERATITNLAYSWNGNSSSAGQKIARDAVYSYMAEVEAELRENPELGIGHVTIPYLKAEMGDSRLSQNQNSVGSDALLAFNVRFYARL